MLTATQALQQTQQNELVMKKRELVTKRWMSATVGSRKIIKIAKLRENGFKVTRDSSELGFKIYWGDPEKFECEEEQ